MIDTNRFFKQACDEKCAINKGIGLTMKVNTFLTTIFEGYIKYHQQ